MKVLSFPHGEILDQNEEQPSPPLDAPSQELMAVLQFIDATISFIGQNPTVPSMRIAEGMKDFLAPYTQGGKVD